MFILMLLGAFLDGSLDVSINGSRDVPFESLDASLDVSFDV